MTRIIGNIRNSINQSLSNTSEKSKFIKQAQERKTNMGTKSPAQHPKMALKPAERPEISVSEPAFAARQPVPKLNPEWLSKNKQNVEPEFEKQAWSQAEDPLETLMRDQFKTLQSLQAIVEEKLNKRHDADPPANVTSALKFKLGSKFGDSEALMAEVDTLNTHIETLKKEEAKPLPVVQPSNSMRLTSMRNKVQHTKGRTLPTLPESSRRLLSDAQEKQKSEQTSAITKVKPLTLLMVACLIIGYAQVY